MSATRVKPGDVLGGKYRVERVIGTGGMGIVVAAKHIELNQRVALKFMLKEALADGQHAERFLREAKAAVQLKSSHTAKVLDVGKLANGEPYMVMEYLEGRDLDAELQERGTIPPHLAVEYILQASEALAEAHGLSMVHRDVKLKNLFLTTTIDGRPLVKVLDFGLAKTLGSSADVSLTAVNSVFGSPQYMSPEQMKSAKDVDSRSDIWSLGVCLYELLTGRVPYDAAGVAEICAMVLKDPVPPPSQFTLGIPPDLEAVIMRCLEKDLSRRFQSIAEVAFALQPYTSDEGSARRILTVMQQSAAQKAIHPTMINADAPGIDGHGKTLNAWDSGVANGTRSTRTLSKGQVGLVIAVSLFMAMAGLGLGVVYVKRRPTITTTPPIVQPIAAESGDHPVEPPPAAITLPPPAPDPTSDTAQLGDDPALKKKPVTAPPPTQPPAAHTTSRPTPSPTPSSKKAIPGRGADYM